MNEKIVDFHITQVVTRDLLRDAFQGIRNLFGFRLRAYEDRINKTLDKIYEEMRLKHKDILWYRTTINPLTTGAIMITVYGEAKENDEI